MLSMNLTMLKFKSKIELDRFSDFFDEILEFIEDKNTSSNPGLLLYDEKSKEPMTQRQSFKLTAISIHSCLSIASIVGNLFFCVIIWRQKKMNSITNLLMTNLALSNVAFASFNLPLLTFRVILQWEWMFGVFLCKFASTVHHITATTSFYSIAFLALDRWLTVAMKKQYFSKKIAISTVSSLWTMSLLLSGPHFYFYGLKRPFLSDKQYCIIICDDCHKRLLIMSVIMQYLVPLCVISPTYIHLGVFLWRRPSIGAQTPHKIRINRSKKRKALGMLLSIVTMYVLCWSPVYIHALCLLFNVLNMDNLLLTFLGAQFMAGISICLTPVLYLVNDGFRAEIGALCCRQEGVRERRRTWDNSDTLDLLVSRRESRCQRMETAVVCETVV